MKTKKRKQIGMRTAASLFSKEFKSGLKRAITDAANESISEVLLEAATEIKSDVAISFFFDGNTRISVVGGGDMVEWDSETLSELVDGFIRFRVSDSEERDADQCELIAAEMEENSKKLRAAADLIRANNNQTK